MRRTSCLLMILAFTGLGCVNPGTPVAVAANKAPPVRMVPAPPQQPLPTVTADRVNEGNAVEMAQALARELDRAENERASASAVAATQPNAMNP